MENRECHTKKKFMLALCPQPVLWFHRPLCKPDVTTLCVLLLKYNCYLYFCTILYKCLHI